MKGARALSPNELIEVVAEIQAVLYLTVDARGRDVYAPDAEWDSETIEHVADVLERHGLTPEKDEPARHRSRLHKEKRRRRGTR